MTGRRLYECVTRELSLRLPGGAHHSRSWNDTQHHTAGIQVQAVVYGPYGAPGMSPIAPPAFDFLPEYERDAWNNAAKRLSGRR